MMLVLPVTCAREVVQTLPFRGRRSRNKVSVGNPLASLSLSPMATTASGFVSPTPAVNMHVNDPSIQAKTGKPLQPRKGALRDSKQRQCLNASSSIEQHTHTQHQQHCCCCCCWLFLLLEAATHSNCGKLLKLIRYRGCLATSSAAGKATPFWMVTSR